MAKNQNPEDQAGLQSSKLDDLENEARAAEGTFEFVDVVPPAPDPAPAVTLDAESYAIMWKGLFSVVAGRSGAHWNLTEAEANHLAAATGPVANKYLPAALNRYGAEVALAAAMFFVCMPRMVKDRDEKKSGSVDDPRGEGSRKVNFAPGAYSEKTI